MSLEIWLLFVGTELLLCLSPGPAILLVVSTSLRVGLKKGLCAGAGILTMNVVFFLLSATGLGVLLIASEKSYLMVKWAGALYLIWLGFRLLKCHPESTAKLHNKPASESVGTFLQGMVIQGANPKALIFFVAILPQFVDPANPVGLQIAILAVSSLAIEFAVQASYATLASHAGYFAKRPGFETLVNRSSGGLLIFAGTCLATIKRL